MVHLVEGYVTCIWSWIFDRVRVGVADIPQDVESHPFERASGRGRHQLRVKLIGSQYMMSRKASLLEWGLSTFIHRFLDCRITNSACVDPDH